MMINTRVWDFQHFITTGHFHYLRHEDWDIPLCTEVTNKSNKTINPEEFPTSI